MLDDITVDTIMSKNLITLHPKEKLKRAKEIFEEYKIHHIPVEVMGKIRGIISLGDILFLEGMVTTSFDKFLKKKKYEVATVDDIMTSNPICIQDTAMLSEALDVMIIERINAIPVRKEDKLVGLITSYDILKYLKSEIK